MQLPLDNVDLAEHFVAFAVLGEPQPQGSKVARIMGERVPIRGGRLAILNPIAVMTEQADMAGKWKKGGRLKKWRASVAAAAHDAMSGRDLIGCSVELSAEFVFARPPSHWTDRSGVRKGARSTPPIDLSKLVRAIEDAMTGTVYVDDKQVRWYRNVRKRYAETQAGVGGVSIEVRAIL